MIAKIIIEAPVNESVRDLIDELGGLIKYINYPHPDFLIDIQASKEISGGLDELHEVINANCDKSYTMTELLSSQYVHVLIPPKDDTLCNVDRRDRSKEIVKAWLRTNVSDEQLDILANSAKADIWYYAGEHCDTETQRIIEETQNAMSEVSSIIFEMMDSCS